MSYLQPHICELPPINHAHRLLLVPARKKREIARTDHLAEHGCRVATRFASGKMAVAKADLGENVE